MLGLKWINADEALPSPRNAVDPDHRFPGLLAFSDDINAERLMEAYSQGMFPWYSEGEPVMWWSTDPRMVLETKAFKVSRSFKKTLRHFFIDLSFEIKIDHSFREVMQTCASIRRPDQDGTWITEEIIQAYVDLHHQGHAHSIEVWHHERMVGGLYCVNIGTMVYGESMFAHETNASKLALWCLCTWCRSVGIEKIDCQQVTRHLESLGASPIPRDAFLDWVDAQILLPEPNWHFDKNTLQPFL